MDIRRENPAISHLAETDLKKSLQIIHQTIVQEAIESYKCCVVLGGSSYHVPQDARSPNKGPEFPCTLKATCQS